MKKFTEEQYRKMAEAEGDAEFECRNPGDFNNQTNKPEADAGSGDLPPMVVIPRCELERGEGTYFMVWDEKDPFHTDPNEDVFYTLGSLLAASEARVKELEKENQDIWAKCPNEEWECTKILRRLEAQLKAERERSALLAAALKEPMKLIHYEYCTHDGECGADVKGCENKLQAAALAQYESGQTNQEILERIAAAEANPNLQHIKQKEGDNDYDLIGKGGGT